MVPCQTSSSPSANGCRSTSWRTPAWSSTRWAGPCRLGHRRVRRTRGCSWPATWPPGPRPSLSPWGKDTRRPSPCTATSRAWTPRRTAGRPSIPPEYYLQKMYAPSPDEAVVRHTRRPAGAHARVDPGMDARGIRTCRWNWVGPRVDGQREAIRCMRCQTHVCVACTMCARVCPDNCIDVAGLRHRATRRIVTTGTTSSWSGAASAGCARTSAPRRPSAWPRASTTPDATRASLFYDRDVMLRPFDGPEEIENKDGFP